MAAERLSGWDAPYGRRWGRATTSHDDRGCETRPPSPEAGGARGDRVPGPLQVAQVLLGLSALGDLLWAVIALGLGWMGLRLAQESSPSQGVDGVVALLALLGLYLVAVAVIKLRIKRWIAAGNAKARDALRALITVDTLVTVVAIALGAASVLSMVMVVAYGVMAALVWGPESSRRHFGDLAPAPARPTHLGSHPAPHPPAPTPFRTAAQRTATARQDPMTAPIRIPGQ